MAVTKFFIGNAQDIADQWKAVPANVKVGDIFRLTINEKNIELEYGKFAVDGDTPEEHLCNAFEDAINETDIPEWTEVEATSTYEYIDGVQTYYVLLVARTKGMPVTITASTTRSFSVTVTTVREGAAISNEVQTVQLAGVPTGGTFTLTFDGQTTGNLAWDISAAALVTALNLLSNIAPGDVTATLAGSGTVADPYIWTVTFTGTYAGVNVPQMTGDGTLLTGITGAQYIAHATPTQGQSGTNEVRKLAYTVTDPTSPSSCQISTGGGLPGGVTIITSAYDAATAQSAIEGVLGIGTVQVTKTETSAIVGYFLIEFIGTLGQQDIVTGDFAAGTPTNGTWTMTTQTEGSATAVDEVQTITIRLAPTGGTWTVTFGGATTAAQVFNESAANLQTDLEALASIGAGNIAVTRAGSGTVTSPYVYTCTFQGALAGTDVAQMTSTSSLTGCAVNVDSTTPITNVNEQKLITINGGPTGGTFTLTLNAETTGPIAYNATAAAVQTEIEGLTTPVPGDVTITGAAGGPYLYEFTGAYAATDIADTALTGSGASLTGSGTHTLTLTHEVTATGKSYFDNVDNWSDGVVPVSTDTIYFANSSISLLYNIDQSAIVLAACHIERSYTGQIGLPDWTGTYYEYRGKSFNITTTILNIGQGIGEGSSFIRINNGTGQVTGTVYATGGSGDLYPCAVLWKGTHASNAWKIFQGSFAAAYFQTETATIATLELGHSGSPDNDVTFIGGAGLTLGTSAKKWGGEATFNSAVPTLWNIGGNVTMVGSGGCATSFLLQEGGCFWKSTGTITSLVVGKGGTFDKRGYTGANTITTLQMHAGAAFYGHINNLTFTNPIQLVQASIEEVTLDLGTNLSLAPVAL